MSLLLCGSGTVDDLVHVFQHIPIEMFRQLIADHTVNYHINDMLITAVTTCGRLDLSELTQLGPRWTSAIRDAEHLALKQQSLFAPNLHRIWHLTALVARGCPLPRRWNLRGIDPYAVFYWQMSDALRIRMYIAMYCLMSTDTDAKQQPWTNKQFRVRFFKATEKHAPQVDPDFFSLVRLPLNDWPQTRPYHTLHLRTEQNWPLNNLRALRRKKWAALPERFYVVLFDLLGTVRLSAQSIFSPAVEQNAMRFLAIYDRLHNDLQQKMCCVLGGVDMEVIFDRHITIAANEQIWRESDTAPIIWEL